MYGVINYIDVGINTMKISLCYAVCPVVLRHRTDKKPFVKRQYRIIFYMQAMVVSPVKEKPFIG
jgi:hypothetical protein